MAVTRCPRLRRACDHRYPTAVTRCPRLRRACDHRYPTPLLSHDTSAPSPPSRYASRASSHAVPSAESSSAASASAPAAIIDRNRISPIITSPLALIAPFHKPSCGVWQNRWPSTPVLGSSVTSNRSTDQERSAFANRAPVPTGPTQLVTARNCPGIAGCGVHLRLALDASVDDNAHSTCGHTAAGEAWT